ncbi:hypothetical protein DACRYDRAFT_24488 [Dacryopinax primogenitus]|uniref:Uncharacterized protein n=1 Tax=Dacryopinax primogenitus (strain DJM 731) TaxID=1858805 RepID=M5FPB6_DACPD|nr:uncharacterized protein DACRYDRAFT_24488 [Dacryopinax primogenitus]EJT98410.1 hypothetical protein DACRYDRAFT_24488 [Dacryopinax primogenitus]
MRTIVLFELASRGDLHLVSVINLNPRPVSILLRLSSTSERSAHKANGGLMKDASSARQHL